MFAAMKAAAENSRKLQLTYSPLRSRLCASLFFALLLAISLQRHGVASLSPEDPVPEDPTGYFATNSLHETFNKRLSFNQYVAYSQRSLALVAGYDNDLHRYDDRQHLVDSFARNGTRSHLLAEDLGYLANARYDSNEFELLHDQPDATLIENELNQERCAQQLDFLYKQALSLFASYDSFTQSKRLDLIDFFDSFGAAPGEQLAMGSNQWLGSFQQCQRAHVDMSADLYDDMSTGARGRRARQDANHAISGRYCVARLRLPSQPTSEPAGSSPSQKSSVPSPSSAPSRASLSGEPAIKLGVCLPQSCNSISILRHANRLEALLKLVRLKQVPYSSARLVQLYCLPDEDSPLRQLSLSARVFLTLASCWLTLVLCVSLKYAHDSQRHERLADANCDNGQTYAAGRRRESKLVQIFAFQYAWRRLFASEEVGAAPSGSDKGKGAKDAGACAARLRPQVARRTNLSQFLASEQATGAPKTVDGAAMPKSMIVMKIHSRSASASSSASSESALSGDEHEDGHVRQVERPETIPVSATLRAASRTEFKRDSALLFKSISNRRQLNAIDGIKVISMIWLVSAHTMLFFIRNISNGRDFWSLVLDFRFMTIMAGIFPVDSFFTITGVLTSYLKFNKTPGAGSGAKGFLRRPSYWLEIFVHRYLRFMPMYLLIFWYTRDVSEYIGQGPMWDYATASTSLRSMCKRESVLVPMLFQANFKPIDQHCVKPAWYLANDYQYLLITPVFMLLLLLSKWFGYLAIAGSVAASLVLQFLTVYYPESADSATSSAAFSDFAGLVNFRPMFATYVLKDLWRLYVLPYNRIPPYLIGLLTGHLMYKFNKRRLKAATAVADAAAAAVAAAAENEQEAQSASCSASPTLSSASTESFAFSTSSGVSSQQDPETSLSVSQQVFATTAVPPMPLSRPPVAARRAAKSSGRNSLLDFLKHGLVNMEIWSPLLVLIGVIYLPLATKLLEPQAGESARIGASLIIALMRFFWSLSIARLIYVCFVATSPGEPTQASRLRCNKSPVVDMLSSSLWKPWSKIGLSVLLIQWEVIGYVAQIQTSLPFMSFSFLLAMVFICIIVSYALGLVVYLVFEFPLSQIELLCIRPKLFG